MKNSDKNKTMFIGSGSHTAFIKVKKGQRVMIGSGEHSAFVRSEETIEDSMNDLLYSKPVAFARKMVRKLKR